MLRSFLYPAFVPGRGAVGLLILRVVTGAAFILHGWGKVQNATGWMTAVGFPNPPPGPVQALAAFAEFGGGIALILGLLTPLAALLIAGTMVGALTLVHLHDPFVASGKGPSQEPAAVYLAIMLLLLTVGPGALSLDAALFGSRQPAGSGPGYPPVP